MSTAYAWAPITKVEEQEDGTVLVHGPVSDGGLDRDRQRMDQAWLDVALPKWEAEGANVREQHLSTRAVGVGVGLSRRADGVHDLTALVVDPIAVKKVQTKVLKGFSIGIREPRLDMGKTDAPNGVIVGGDIIEVSLVDRPANPRTTFTMAKADAGELAAVEEPEVEELEDEADEPEADEPDETKADIDQAQRDRDAASGVAMPGGQFPIPDEGHLRSAIGHLGNYQGDKTAARRHIIARARALGLTHLLPAEWNVTKADAIAAEMAPLLPDVTKADAATDIATAHQAIGLLAQLIASEAEEMGKGVLSESCDIDCLQDAVRALKFFIASEQGEQQEAAATVPEDVDPDAATEVADSMSVSGGTYMADDVKTDTPDVSKVDGGYLTKADADAMLSTAVAEATKPLEERLAKAEAEAVLFKADLAKALEMPAGGGPVATRTASQTAAARAKDAAALRDQYLAKADATNDPDLRKGYRELADQSQG